MAITKGLSLFILFILCPFYSIACLTCSNSTDCFSTCNVGTVSSGSCLLGTIYKDAYTGTTINYWQFTWDGNPIYLTCTAENNLELDLLYIPTPGSSCCYSPSLDSTAH